MNKRIDKQTDGQTDDGGSVHRLNFPSLASQKKEEKKDREPNFTSLYFEFEHSI